MISYQEFLRHVRQANSHYERFYKATGGIFGGKSSLHQLDSAVRQGQPNGREIARLINQLSNSKQRKYSAALDYLRGCPEVQSYLRTDQRIGQLQSVINGQSGLRGINDHKRNLAQKDIELRENIEQHMWNGTDNQWDRYAWEVRLRVRVYGTGEGSSPGEITVFVPILALHGNQGPGLPDDSVAVAPSQAIKAAWSSTIAERWHGATYLVKDNQTGRLLKKYNIVCRVDWVTEPGDAAYTVYCVRSTIPNHDGTVDMAYWGANDGVAGKSAIAHEYGHMLGNPDEYGTVFFNGQQVTNNSGIMDNEHTQPKPGHYFMIAKAIRRHAHGLPPRRRQSQYIALPTGAQYRIGSDHPWAG